MPRPTNASKRLPTPKTIFYCGRRLRVPPAVWGEMMRQARKDKRWAATADPKMMCDLSKEAIAKYKGMTVQALATDHYGYFYHRSHLTSRGYVVDPAWATKWKKLTGRKPIFFKEEKAS